MVVQERRQHYSSSWSIVRVEVNEEVVIEVNVNT